MLGISKETVHNLPEVHYPGRVVLIDSAAKARDAVAYLQKQPQIGFDTETRPSFQKNHRYKVSLVQLSVPGECFLFRLKQIGSLDGLMSIFENPAIQKIGLSLKDDFHSLAKLCEFTPAGFVELQTFVKEYEIADNSLQKIFALIFGQRISKNQRLTNWEAAELTPGQQSYAAIDAWACVEIYNHLLAGKFNPEECPYKIDDETARMLQNSVGIHLPLKTAEDNTSDDTPSLAIAESTAINGTPVKRSRRVPSKVAKAGKSSARSGKSGSSAAKSDAATPVSKRRRSKSAATATRSASASDTKQTAKKAAEVKKEVKTKGAAPKTAKTAKTPKAKKVSKAAKTTKAAKTEKTEKTGKTATTKTSTAKRSSRAKAASKTAATAKRKTANSKATTKPADK